VRWSGANPRPWSSTESNTSGYGTDSSHKRSQTMNKASSLPTQRTNHQDDKWRMSKTDSQSSGASSLSSPQQTKVQPSTETSSATSPAAQPNTEPPFLRLPNEQQQLVVWVATALDQIPAGALVIDPNTCETPETTLRFILSVIVSRSGLHQSRWFSIPMAATASCSSRASCANSKPDDGAYPAPCAMSGGPPTDGPTRAAATASPGCA
jgi:hypothetical protein